MPSSDPIRLSIQPEVRHAMASGAGASWHALLHPTLGHGGSAFGGTPPVTPRHARLWKSIEKHAAWLGLKFIRAEIDWRCWQPERGTYTWDSPEMQILERMLTWSDRHGADVMLQCMWHDVDWLAYPEYRGDPALRQVSAACDPELFAASWVELLEELVTRRGHTSIRWINLVNEPNWYWWLVPPDTRETRDAVRQAEALAACLRAVRAAVGEAGLPVKLMGPDYTDLPVIPELPDEPWWPYVDDVDVHSYCSCFDWEDPTGLPADSAYRMGERLERTLTPWRRQTREVGRGLYLTEAGTQTYGYKADDPAPGSFRASLKDTQLLIRALNIGVDGFNHWSFTNRGDQDGQWQFIDTWDRQWKLWLEEAVPHYAAYYVLGLANRHLPHRAEILETRLAGGEVDGLRRVFAAAVRSPTDGGLTVLAVNDAEQGFKLELDAIRVSSQSLQRLCAACDKSAEAILRYEPVSAGGEPLELPPFSLTILTDTPLDPEGPGRC